VILFFVFACSSLKRALISSLLNSVLVSSAVLLKDVFALGISALIFNLRKWFVIASTQVEILNAKKSELEAQIAKAEELVYQTQSMTEPEAYTSANRQMLEAIDKDNTELQEMVDLLKAIRDHLSGAATLQVEIM